MKVYVVEFRDHDSTYTFKSVQPELAMVWMQQDGLRFIAAFTLEQDARGYVNLLNARVS
jgi:hypothetical protein